jgi:hypothetical protein
MDRIFVLIFGVPLGVLMMIYRVQIKSVTGDIGWAERNIGGGGTYTLIAIIGLLVSILSLMYALGTLQEFMVNNLGGFFKPAQP